MKQIFKLNRFSECLISVKHFEPNITQSNHSSNGLTLFSNPGSLVAVCKELINSKNKPQNLLEDAYKTSRSFKESGWDKKWLQLVNELR